MAKAKISPLEILNHDERSGYTTVRYRDKEYIRKQARRWFEILPPDNYPPTSECYDWCFIDHLERVWDHHIGTKKIVVTRTITIC